MRVINTNMVWNYYLSEQAAKRMKENGGGNSIFINSNTTYRAIPNRITYSASKGGQLGMMCVMALDLGKYNIRVNAVLPGMIKTDRWDKNPEFYAKVPPRFTPLQDVAVGEDVADALTNGDVSADVNRIISQKSIDVMRTPVVPGSMFQGGKLAEGYEYGLGVRTFVHPGMDGQLLNIREFGWDGAAGSYVMVDLS